MKILDPIIAPEKLTRYLLVRRPRGDKSGYLALAGFSADNPSALMAELPVATIWLRKADGRDHFVTLLPRRGDGDAT